MTTDNSGRLQAIRARLASADFVSYRLERREPDGFLRYGEYDPQAGDDLDFLLSEVARLEAENAALRAEQHDACIRIDNLIERMNETDNLVQQAVAIIEYHRQNHGQR